MSTTRCSSVLAAIAGVVAVTLTITGPAFAGPGGTLRIEKAWHEGQAVNFLQPAVFSANPNGGTLACFGLGPDLSGITRPFRPLYVIFDDTATQDHCDGQPTVLRHDHILSSRRATPAIRARGRSCCWSNLRRD